MSESAYQLSVDVGGTFTDFVFCYEDGSTELLKSVSTPNDISEGIFHGIEKAAQRKRVEVGAFLGRCRSLALGTTVATNAILQNRTARTALLCTEGHSQVLLIREGHKIDVHNFRVDYPEPYIPQTLTFEVRERIVSDGSVAVALDENRLRETIATIARRDVEAIAVSFLWSIANPAHELRAAEIVAELLPDVPVTLGHRISPSIREYRRTSTAAIDASLKTIVGRNLDRIRERLSLAGFGGTLSVITSTGGRVSVEEALASPVNLCLSGPSGAPVASRWLCGREELRSPDTITGDMGGTSFDVSLCIGGENLIHRHGKIGGHIFAVPAAEILTIGAGGGSIAEIDKGGMIHVGRQSAGSVPGPACYGRGGGFATVTDANLVRGLIATESFGDGSLSLSASLAHRAIDENVAKPLGLDVLDAACLISAVVEQKMATAIEEITIKRGLDTRDFTLVAGGSAAGLHMARIAQILQVRQVLFPRVAGVLSAFGIAAGDIKRYFGRSFHTRSDLFDAQGVEAVLADLILEAENFLERMEVEPHARVLNFTAEACYPDQIWNLTTPFDRDRIASEGIAPIVARFHEIHRLKYRTNSPAEPVEFWEWGVEAIGKRAFDAARFVDETRIADTPRAGVRTVRISSGVDVEAPVFDRANLAPGSRVAGPAIIQDHLSIVLVPEKAEATFTANGNILVDIN
ncbi:MAG: hydantoinase/oxoprolinase family protein [Rhizobiaceae bacterium]